MKCYWFGDSWTYGSEIEKCNGPDWQAHNQDLFREQNRFSTLVSIDMGWESINLAQPGISSERLVLELTKHIDEIKNTNGIVIIVWPSFSRYFWIDDASTQHDIRISDQWDKWYRDVDNYPYQMYNAQRCTWSAHNLLKSFGIPYYFINSVYRITDPFYFDMSEQRWINSYTWRISDILEFDVDKGYPPASSRHKSLYPCESHPNLYGHKSISREIIKFLQSQEENNS